MANNVNTTPGAIEPDYADLLAVTNTLYLTSGALQPGQITLRINNLVAAMRRQGRMKCERRHPRNKIKHCT